MTDLDEDVLNLEVRRFLKKLGVTAQRELERTIREAHANGQLADGEPVRALATIRLNGTDLDLTLDERIAWRT